MGYGKIIAGAVLAVGLAGCTAIPKEQTVAQYCSDADNAFKNVCRLKVEIDGTSTALADTNMRLGEALVLANAAQDSADAAMGAAARAQSTADAAMSRADQAMLKTDDMVCETNTIQKTNIGSCRPGYTLMGCTQTRYTYRAGGPSILREINDQQCRFNDRVLEMQVRCCSLASNAPRPMNTVVDANQPESYPRRTTTTTNNNLRY